MLLLEAAPPTVLWLLLSRMELAARWKWEGPAMAYARAALPRLELKDARLEELPLWSTDLPSLLLDGDLLLSYLRSFLARSEGDMLGGRAEEP